MILIPLTDVTDISKYMEIDCLLLGRGKYYVIKSSLLWRDKRYNFLDNRGMIINGK